MTREQGEGESLLLTPHDSPLGYGEKEGLAGNGACSSCHLVAPKPCGTYGSFHRNVSRLESFVVLPLGVTP